VTSWIVPVVQKNKEIHEVTRTTRTKILPSIDMIAKPRTSNPQRSSPHTTYPATTSTAASMVSLEGLGISRECHALFRTDVTII